MKTRVKKTAVKRTRKKPMINNIYKSLIIFWTIIYSRIQVVSRANCIGWSCSFVDRSYFQAEPKNCEWKEIWAR